MRLKIKRPRNAHPADQLSTTDTAVTTEQEQTEDMQPKRRLLKLKRPQLVRAADEQTHRSAQAVAQQHAAHRAQLIAQLLQEQQQLRLFVEKKLQQHVAPWHSCTCNCITCKRAAVWRNCPVHYKPKAGVLEAHDLLRSTLPGCMIIAEMPLLSEFKQGRAINGLFMGDTQADLRVDLVVQSPDNVWHGFEVHGVEHRKEAVRMRDAKKLNTAQKFGLGITVLELTAEREPQLTKWSTQMTEMKFKLGM
jgi:hypothetical protein